MDNNNFDDIIARSLALRKKYHELELQHHGKEWSVSEDALAFLTDAGLVGRHTMSQQQRWPKADTDKELEHIIDLSVPPNYFLKKLIFLTHYIRINFLRKHNIKLKK